MGEKQNQPFQLAAAVRGNVGPDRATAGTDGIDNGGQVGSGFRLQRVGVRRSVAKVAEYRAISVVLVRISDRWGRSG
jgi:hypothetical protein